MIDHDVEADLEPSRLNPPALSDRVDDALVWCDRHRERIGLLVVVAIVGCVGVWLWQWATAAAPVDDAIPLIDPEVPPAASTTQEVSTAEAPTTVIVHVSGAVVEPGVYRLDSTARAVDAIDAAGGAVPDADLDRVNLAAPLIDGSQLRVPVFGESDPVVVVPETVAETGDTGSGLVDLNTATAAQLESLHGVGPATAGAIIDWRDENGGFSSIDQLLEVPGIGPAKFEGLLGRVVVG